MRLQSSHLHTQEHEHERPVFHQACDPDGNNCFNDSLSTVIPAYTPVVGIVALRKPSLVQAETCLHSHLFCPSEY
jgi:hypothetical protein